MNTVYGAVARREKRGDAKRIGDGNEKETEHARVVGVGRIGRRKGKGGKQR